MSAWEYITAGPSEGIQYSEAWEYNTGPRREAAGPVCTIYTRLARWCCTMPWCTTPLHHVECTHHVVHSSGVSRKRWADAGGGAPSSQSWQTAPPPFLHTIDNLSPLPFPQLARGIRSRNVTSFDARENSYSNQNRKQKIYHCPGFKTTLLRNWDSIFQEAHCVS